MNIKNIEILNDTLASLGSGWYMADGAKTRFKLTQAERNRVELYMPDAELPVTDTRNSDCIITCDAEDTVSQAVQMAREDPGDRVLALNFASPVHPGGGARRGSSAQEENICRRTSLLPTLESEEAEPYYTYHKGLSTFMGSDAILFTPSVEAFKDSAYRPMKDSAIFSVITCAAPKVTRGYEDLDFYTYADLLEKRIRRMLRFAAYKGYRRLVLGAWGCGAYGNDPVLVSDLFAKVLSEREYRCFDRISFAVPFTPGKDNTNYYEFARNFGRR